MIKTSKLLVIWMCCWAGVVAFQYYKRDVSLYSKSNDNHNIEQKTSHQVGRFSLEIHTIPKVARIRIMNIKEKFTNGMFLPEGNYRVYVDAPNFKDKEFMVKLDENYKKLTVKLERL
jgi:hypothetical protein